MTLDGARNAFRDTVLGLEYLHYQGVIHRDIKPANLLQTKSHVTKISDFGVSYLGRESGYLPGIGDDTESDAPDADEAIELAKTVGTPAFYAPELCNTDPDADAPPISGQIDVWALGVTLYCLVYGRVPFHDNNTFVLMKSIAEDEVLLPRQRLRAVEEKISSRPSSHGRNYFQPMNSNKRTKHELAYEDIDEDLHDLLKRLLVKDPRRRIKLNEVKHHPWLLRGLPSPVAWLDQTDPSNQTQGRRIHVTKEDVADAVVPLNVVERLKSVGRRVAGALGIVSGRSSSSRKRAKSTAANDGGFSSTASSSSTISQDGRRPSRVDESIYKALQASRENEHPLSQSVTASPDVTERPRFFLGPSSRASSPGDDQQEDFDRRSTPAGYERPTRLDRTKSSATSSIKTVKPTDTGAGRGLGSGLSTFPALPSTPLAMDSVTPTNLGGIFGGAGRRLMNSVRSRDRSTASPGGHGRARSIDRVSHYEDAHGEPSVAFSAAYAAGHVDPPEMLREGSATSSAPSPMSSRAPSITSPEAIRAAVHGTNVSRHSSISSASSRPRNATVDEESSPVQDKPGYFGIVSSHLHPDDAANESRTLDEQFDRARDEMFRRRVLESEIDRARPGSAAQTRPESDLSQERCPTSPDDDIFYQKQEEAAHQQQEEHVPDPGNGDFSQLPPHQWVNSSSSEDQLASGLSQSTSNKSIPSVVSASSSVGPDQIPYTVSEKGEKEFSTDESDTTTTTAQDLRSRNDDYDAGYIGDDALETDPEDDSDSEEDSDSDEDFIMMGSKKKKGPHQVRSNSISVAQIARAKPATGSSSIKSTRSGSNNTMKKVRSHSASEGD